jgi:hypothetical protein
MYAWCCLCGWLWFQVAVPTAHVIKAAAVAKPQTARGRSALGDLSTNTVPAPVSDMTKKVCVVQSRLGGLSPD